MNNSVKDILKAVQNGSISVEDAALKLKTAPFEDIRFAKVDLHRGLRQGVAEVIYGAGKTPEQIIGIVDVMRRNEQSTILITRLSAEAADTIKNRVTYELDYHADAKIAIIGTMPKPDGIGKIVVATGGTSDISVAEEAALTAEALGNEVTRIYDVGSQDYTGCLPIWTKL